MTGPQTIGRFELLDPIGRGAMGDVWLAEDPQRGGEVALKWIHIATAHPEGLSAEHRGAERQRRIAECAAQVAEVYEHGEVGEEIFYISMEYVPGRDLAEEITGGPSA